MTSHVGRKLPLVDHSTNDFFSSKETYFQEPVMEEETLDFIKKTSEAQAYTLQSASL
jgi:hypothetical protein